MAALMPYLGAERDPASKLLLQVIASILDEMMKKGEAQRCKDVNRKLTKFHGLRAPSIPVPDYLNRIAQFSGCSNEAFILMLIYIDRLVSNKDIPLDALNVHRLVITGTLLAAKFFDDHYLDNSHYSAVGGLPPHEINELELEMLFLLGFNLFVSTENYNTYFSTLSKMAQSRTTIPNSPSMVISLEDQQLLQQQQQQQQQQAIQCSQEHHFVGHQVPPPENDAWVCVNTNNASAPYTFYEESYGVQPVVQQVSSPEHMMQVGVYPHVQPVNVQFVPPQHGAGTWQQYPHQHHPNEFVMQQQHQYGRGSGYHQGMQQVVPPQQQHVQQQIYHTQHQPMPRGHHSSLHHQVQQQQVPQQQTQKHVMTSNPGSNPTSARA